MNDGSDQKQDEADMERLQAGEESSLKSLIERHGPKLFNYLLRSLQNEEDASDLAQETFVRVYQNRAKFDVKQKFSTWLYTIATNLVKDRFRYRMRHPVVSLDAESHEQQTTLGDTRQSNAPSPFERLDMYERGEAVRRAIERLPEELKTALILFEYEELSHAEVGEILKCSPKAVETRIYRARQHLRKSLHGLLRDS